MKHPVRDLLRALVAPSATSVVVALATALTMLAAVMTVSPSTVAAVIRWYTSYSFQIADDPALCSSKALDLTAAIPGGPALVILGASTTRESLDTARLATLLRSRSEVGIAVHNLTFSSQHVLESMALTDAIPPHFHGTVVIGVNPVRMGKQLAVERYFRGVNVGFSSAALAQEAVYWNMQVRPVTGWYAWDNRQFLLRSWRALVNSLPRVLLHPTRRRIPSEHFYIDVPRRTDAWMRSQYSQVSNSLGAYDATFPKHLATLERLIRALQRRGLRVILLESPINPQFAASLAPSNLYARYADAMTTFAKRERVEYLNLTDAAGLESSEFYDWGHLRSAAAQERYTRALASHLHDYFAAPMP
jgi:hypothetical protein